MVRGITKYATILDKPNTVKHVLEKAIYLASNGRPGPVWIDIPIDVQATSVKTNDLINFNKDDADTFLKDDDVSENTKLEFRLNQHLK